MKKSERLSWLMRGGVALALMLMTVQAEAGRRVGNGDSLRLVFAWAKEHAANVVLKVHEQALHPTTRADVREWLLKNREALAGDIAATEHVWSLDATPACAETDLAPAAQLRLSFVTCGARVMSLDEAGELLVHESVHHFNIADETFADAVAVAVYGAWRRGDLEWTTIPAAGVGRAYATSVWTGDELIVVGGLDVNGRVISAAQKYKPSTDSWTSIQSAGAPARFNAEAIFTGNEVIVWGGYVIRNGEEYWQNSGAVLDIATGRWTALAAGAGPAELTTHLGNSERKYQTLVWTGKEAIVFGGGSTGSRLNGGAYDPVTKRWRDISTNGAPDRLGGHTAVWADNKMIVWGGKDTGLSKTNSGASYDPVTNRWTPLRLENGIGKRDGHVAVWTGAEMIVFGGDVNSAETQGTGGVYDPQTNTWSVIAAESVPARTGHTAVWNGNEMLVIGGKARLSSRSIRFQAVSAFNPATGTWRISESKSAPAGRAFHTAVWAGSNMIVFGGYDADSEPLNSGSAFYP